MKITHINTIQNPKFIIVRQYDHRIVTLPSDTYIKEDGAVGCWRVRMINKIPKEYKQINNTVWQADQKKE
jgi:hypothetical protein